MENEYLFQVIGKLYVEALRTNQALRGLQTSLVEKDKEISRLNELLKGQTLDANSGG